MMIPLAHEIIFAYILDLLCGDPRWFPHPVKAIGWLIQKFEFFLRKSIKTQWLAERTAGSMLALSVIAIVWGVSFFIVKQASDLNRSLGFFVSAFLIYTCLSVKDLKVQSMRVCRSLELNDAPGGRKNLRLIVGRDTDDLDERGIIRATVETVAENIVDGGISPLFYAFIGGAPLALTYKAVNTLDSMLGYRNERYKNFGWASAKIDDAANFIPARLSALFLPIVSWLAGKDGWGSWKMIWRDGKKHPSPNSGIPEAAVAGALGIQLGGLNFYDSVPSLKPFIGDGSTMLTTDHIKESIKIGYMCSALVVISGVLLMLAMGRT